MNVFVLCTGRCGSVTFSKAAAHATNFTAGHETRSHLLGQEHFAYPANHIEVDNRLSWFLGRLHAAFPDAYYVHLVRNRQAVARSFMLRYGRGIIGGYANSILMTLPADAPKLDVCLDYVHTVTENIWQFLRDRPHMVIDIDRAKHGFVEFWQTIGAHGDLEAALAEFDIFYNDDAPIDEQTLRELQAGSSGNWAPA